MTDVLQVFKDLHESGVSPLVLNILGIIIIFYFWDFKIHPVLNRIFHSKLMEMRSKSDASVIDILHQYRDLIICDRISIYEFHNTTYNIYGKSFLKFTCTYEVSRLGIPSYHIKNKDLSISGIKELLNLVETHKIMKIKSLNTDEYTPEFIEFLSSGGFKSGLLVPVIFKGLICGFMIVEFTRAENFSEENEDNIELNSSILVGEIASRVCKGK